MTLDEIDRALADWKARLARIDDNLVALETDPVYTLLERAGETGLEGTTRDRVSPALAAMRELFAQRTLLDDVLEQATAKRAGLNRVWPGDALREIEHLLRGPSIALPPVETPLARRGLLDGAATTSSIAPDQLLGAMVASFEQARDAVAAVSQAWDRLTPQADHAAADADRLEQLAAGLGQDTHSTLSAVRAQLDAVRAAIARDPLGASETLTAGVHQRLQQLEQQLTALRERRLQVDADLRRARQLLDALRATQTRATAAHARCDAEIAGGPPRPQPLDAGRIDGLAQWLETLDTTAGGARWAAAGIGLTRWLAAAQEVETEAEATERANAGPLEKRDELRGRLAARRQQARTLAARGAPVDPDLEGLAAAAAALLDTSPCALDDADAAVRAYEQRLVPHRSGGK